MMFKIKPVELTVGERPPVVAVKPTGVPAGSRCYLSGPMSFRKESDWNYPAFNNAAAALRADEWRVFNPAEAFGGDATRERKDYMRLDIAALLDVDAVIVLPGWSESKGAKLEVAIALELGLPVYRLIVTGCGRIAYMLGCDIYKLTQIFPFTHPTSTRPLERLEKRITEMREQQRRTEKKDECVIPAAVARAHATGVLRAFVKAFNSVQGLSPQRTAATRSDEDDLRNRRIGFH